MEWTGMATLERTFPYTRPRYTGILEWITTTDHKKIGVLYLVTTFFFFLTGGLLALTIRTQLATPDTQLLSPQAYNEAFTMHGTTMVFLFVVPVWTGFANYIIPLQLGARDMAFPRLNALSYWLLLGGGPAPLAVPLLVLRAPRGLHHDPAGLRRDLRSAPGVLAQADLRLQDDRV